MTEPSLYTTYFMSFDDRKNKAIDSFNSRPRLESYDADMEVVYTEFRVAIDHVRDELITILYERIKEIVENNC